MDRKRISKIIKIYLEDLSKFIKIDNAVLFGSSLKGKIKRDSDIDLLVLSSSFDKMTSDKRFDILYKARKRIQTQSVPMDIFGLTPSEYKSASTLSIVGEIKEKGKEIIYKTN